MQCIPATLIAHTILFAVSTVVAADSIAENKIENKSDDNKTASKSNNTEKDDNQQEGEEKNSSSGGWASGGPKVGGGWDGQSNDGARSRE